MDSFEQCAASSTNRWKKVVGKWFCLLNWRNVGSPQSNQERTELHLQDVFILKPLIQFYSDGFIRIQYPVLQPRAVPSSSGGYPSEMQLPGSIHHPIGHGLVSSSVDDDLIKSVAQSYEIEIAHSSYAGSNPSSNSGDPDLHSLQFEPLAEDRFRNMVSFTFCVLSLSVFCSIFSGCCSKMVI